MSERTVKAAELFAYERESLGLNIFIGLSEVQIAPLSDAEVNSLISYIARCYRMLRQVCAEIADDFMNHITLFIKAAQIFKAQTNKAITAPASVNAAGMCMIIPQLFKYVKTPSASEPAYTQYIDNTFKLNLTAGTPVYIFGDGTNYYRACPTSGKRTLLVIIADGLIEIGTTPKLQQQIAYFEGERTEAPEPVHVLKEIPLHSGKTLYRINTYKNAAFIVTKDRGVMYGFMPEADGLDILQPVGVAFYEWDMYNNLKWLT